jgi:hypothetical protein
MQIACISDLIRLYYLRHVSSNQVFILSGTCTVSFMVFYHVIWIYDKYHKTAYTSLPGDEHLVFRIMSKTIQ